MKKRIKALVFDACGTFFDVHSAASACNPKFPEQGNPSKAPVDKLGFMPAATVNSLADRVEAMKA